MSTTAALDGGRRHTAAERYVDHGWSVVPLHTPAGQSCSCRAGDACTSIGKHPRTRDGLHNATTDLAQVREWWRRWPDANVGVATGAPSGVIALDIDLPLGPASLAQLESDHDVLPRTLTQRTGSGGRQLLFARPDEDLRNRAGLKVGIDVRGDGGYVVVPPSIHACGDRYQWTDHTQPAEAPPWLIALIRRPRRRPVDLDRVVAANASVGGRYGRAALAGELIQLAGAPEGTRNHSLNRAAFRLGQLVGAGLLDDDVVRGQLSDVAREIGLSAPETAKTVTSGMSAGISQPRPFKPAVVSRR